MLGKGGGSKLTGTAGKHDGRAVTQSMLVKMLVLSSRIVAAHVPHVRTAKIGYHAIAQAGSSKELYWNQSPCP